MENHKIMIIEDQSIIAAAMKDVLKGYGYRHVIVCRSADQALKALSRDLPDVILMDIRLEGAIDGIDLTTLINRAWNIPVVYTTGNNDEETERRIAQTRHCGVLLKPVDFDELRKLLQKILRNSRKNGAVPDASELCGQNGQVPRPFKSSTAAA